MENDQFKITVSWNISEVKNLAAIYQSNEVAADKFAEMIRAEVKQQILNKLPKGDYTNEVFSQTTS